jgi:hypothetical protein
MKKCKNNGQGRDYIAPGSENRTEAYAGADARPKKSKNHSRVFNLG